MIMAQFQNLLNDLPHQLSGHILLSVLSLACGMTLSVPLGLMSTQYPRLRSALLSVAGTIQTIPSLALLALMVPVMGGVIGMMPAFMALVLYSMLPILRNTITGIAAVDPDIQEAAMGMGMTRRQCLLKIQLPIALPMIVAGIRTASIWVMGMATLATPVGAPCLGYFLFTGLQTRNWGMVLFGCMVAAAMALILDQLIRWIEFGVLRRQRRVTSLGVAAVLLFLVGGVTPGFQSLVVTLEQDLIGRSINPIAQSIEESQETKRKSSKKIDEKPLAGQTITIGTKTFSEQYTLAHMLRQQIEAQGGRTIVKPGMGSSIVFDALRHNTIDCYIDYSGTIWATVMKRDQPIARQAMLIEVAAYLYREYGIVTLGALGFENAYALAMNRERANQLKITSIEDLNLYDDLVVAGDPEVFGRPEWIRVQKTYELENLITRGMDSTFIYGAVRDGQVDVITAYSSDGRIDAFDLVVLKDPKQAFPPYDAILLLSPAASKLPAIEAALKPIMNRVSDQAMRRANRRVDIEGETPSTVGRDLWLDIQP